MNIICDKSKTYLLACSFGPDSMALFDMLIKSNINFVCCHVNYHKRDVSDFEQFALTEFCHIRKIPIEVLDTKGMNVEGNFQAWARDVRYNFFKSVYLKYNASGLFVAHQQDDLLETYLIQKRRNSYVNLFGLTEFSNVKGMKVIRPLLSLSKASLEEYDRKNNIPYSIDCSNLKDDYERNRIRHHVINELSNEQKEELLNEIKDKNIELVKLKSNASLIIRNGLKVDDIINISDDVFAYVLFNLLNKYSINSLSKSFIKELKKLSTSSKANIMVNIADNIYYCQEYGEICIYQRKEPYEYHLDKPGEYIFNEFEIDFSNAEDRNIKSDDFPLTIRPIKTGDKMKIKNYNSLVTRLYLDWKMPKHLRETWPVVINKNNEIVYIPRYRKDFVDKHKSKFLIKIK